METELFHTVVSPGAMAMKRILIVDDESLIRYSLTAALRRDDTTVESVACGKDGLSEFDRNSYDLCFLDIHLPDMNGLDIMKTFRKASPETKIVILTGSEVDDEMMKSIQENAQLLVAKPFDLDQIKTCTEHLLAHETPVFPAGHYFYNDKDEVAFINRRVDDKRQFNRLAVAQNTACSVVAEDNGQGESSFNADILEISDAGTCIRTSYPLKPGQVLRFSDNFAMRTGVVRWSRCGEAEDSYCAGIQFVMPENTPARVAGAFR
jgi:DNA-binding response OmpR family regulator